MLKTISSFSLLFLLLLLAENCMTVPVHTRQNKYIYSFSDLPLPSKTKFELVETNWYWMGIAISKISDVDGMLLSELYRVSDARGVKNLEIKVFNKTWNSYYLLPNPFAIITGTYVAVIGNAIGFTNRSYHIKGEIF